MNEIFLLHEGAAGMAGWMAHGGALLAQADGGVSFNLVATFSRAEIFGKVIVILLLFFSLLAWTVMIGKYLDLSNRRQLNRAFQARLKQATTPLLEANVTNTTRQGGPYARLFYDAVQAARQHRADGEASVRMGLIENALQRGVADECVQYETKMVVLGSLVSGAPFIGLLGTVWGVMVAFSGMGMTGHDSLQALAPGVASALLATVSGLLVAIPSVFGYNFLLTHVKMMITEIENFASWLADRLELEMEAAKMAPAAAEAAPAAVPATVAPAAAPTAPAAYSAPAAIAPTAPAQVATAAPVMPPAPPAPPAEPMPGDPAVAAAERYLRLDVSEGEKS
jgi:biopolymer transport protein TolQ